MGGLVGGAYAGGLTPEEIRGLMRETDWDAMFDPDSPFEDKTFRRKQDRRLYPSALEFGLKHGFSMAAGLNSGQQVAFLLRPRHAALLGHRVVRPACRRRSAASPSTCGRRRSSCSATARCRRRFGPRCRSRRCSARWRSGRSCWSTAAS
ncbi:MAG: hypothetical protein MZU95_01245 [Desulfomicrobium escambiense]|nr:hypothetical protein [Desulfomicrobium escambiense]